MIKTKNIRSPVLIITVFLCLVTVNMVSVQNVYGDFNDIGLGARPFGMGNAYTAVADDVFAMYYNPAGLAFIKRSQMAAEYGKLFMGLDDGSNLQRSFLGYVHPFRIPRDKQRFWKKKHVDPLKSPYRDYGVLGFGLSTFSLVGEYEERTLYISYARQVLSGFSLGVNIKNLYEKYVIDDYMRIDPVFNYGSKNSLQTVSFDFGAFYRVGRNGTLGFAVWDVNQPDVGFKSTNRLKRLFRWGGAYHIRGVTTLIDVVKKKDDLNIHIGAEKWLFRKMFGFRAGYMQGSRELRNYSAGLSFDMFDMVFDYGFQIPLAGIKKTTGSHRVSFTFRFGREGRLDLSNDRLEEAFIRIQKEHKDLAEVHSRVKFNKEKLEEKYLADTTQQLEEIKKLRMHEQELKEKLKNRPVRVIRKKPVKRGPPPLEYTVKEGDTLRSIARELYGDPLRWNDLYYANKDKITRSRVEPGQVLAVPR